jgi:spermidine synthase
VGTLAAYAQAGDALRCYEINPEVVKLSMGARPYFTYLQHCAAQVEVVLGDARISLQRELDQHDPQNFDVLVIDAFNSDSIPVHLLTKEAVGLYLRHLRMPDGILAIHISNRYLDLNPVVWGLADHFGLTSAYIDTQSEDGIAWGSSWILLAVNPGVLLQPEIAIATTPRKSTAPLLWTDDFSNLFQILKK